MSIVVDLPPELGAELALEAARLNLPLAEYVARILATGNCPDPKPNNGADLVSYWRKAGVVGTRTDITDAAEHARRIRNQAEHRERS